MLGKNKGKGLSFPQDSFVKHFSQSEETFKCHLFSYTHATLLLRTVVVNEGPLMKKQVDQDTRLCDRLRHVRLTQHDAASWKNTQCTMFTSHAFHSCESNQTTPCKDTPAIKNASS